MKVYLHEFITSGALAGGPLPPSLLREGLAMRRAVAADLAALPDVHVVTTRDERVPPLDVVGAQEVTVPCGGGEPELFRSLCGSSDRCLVIAPELEGELGRRVSLAIETAGAERVLNSSTLTKVASDKWETYRRLAQAKVPTIRSSLASADEWKTWNRPMIKPRDGAGSQGIRRLEPDAFKAGGGDIDRMNDWIVQPFVSGRWLSCTVLYRADGGRDIFPPAEQQIAGNGTFTYRGGMMPAECDRDRVQELAARAIEALCTRDELIGPVGVDVVEVEGTADLLVCEVNPRFTTSFVAARQLAEGNLLAGLMMEGAGATGWGGDHVEFDAEGNVTRRALRG